MTGKERGNRSARKEKGNLPDVIELAVGMEVMVTYDVETELDVANGARGVVQEVILDRRELLPDGLAESPRDVTLKYPPECVLVKLARTKARTLLGLEEDVVPIVPIEQGYEILLKGDKRKWVLRRQLPMTAAYMFTDYRAQGQTIRRVIVDIPRPPLGELAPFKTSLSHAGEGGCTAYTPD
ncbi:hypothetical protein FRC10_000549 [Ceratobasidium sp. 414]|nr:hypothetical protein FRC10_000549 [Ceratobasidium sp. 414]